MEPYVVSDEILDELYAFNKKAWNAGLEFKVELDPESKGPSRSLLVLGSVDFAYYVNLLLNFRELAWTNIPDGANWPDAWDQNQLVLADADDREDFEEREGLMLQPEQLLFFFNRDNQAKEGAAIVCSAFSVNWYTR